MKINLIAWSKLPKEIFLNFIRGGAIVGLSVSSLAGFGFSATHPPLPTVDYVDLQRYAGKWHQIAFLPNTFQKNCTIDTTAYYTLRDDGKVGVRNECTKNNGKRNSIEGTARVVDDPSNTKSNAKLKVKFFWFAPSGDYWILKLGKGYEDVLVGTPSRKYLWILARSPGMKKQRYLELVDYARSQGFPVDHLDITGQVH